MYIRILGWIQEVEMYLFIIKVHIRGAYSSANADFCLNASLLKEY